MPLDAELFGYGQRCHVHVGKRLHRARDVALHEEVSRLRTAAFDIAYLEALLRHSA